MIAYLTRALCRLHNFFGRCPAATWLVALAGAVLLANRVLGLVDGGALDSYALAAVFALALVMPSLAPNGAPLLSWAAEIVRRAHEEAHERAHEQPPARSPLGNRLLGREPHPDTYLRARHDVTLSSPDPDEPPC